MKLSNGQSPFLQVFLLLLLLYWSGAASAQTKTLPEEKSVTSLRGSITGQINGDDGQPLAGIGVSVLRSTGSNSVHRTALTDGEGKFTLNDLPVGSYRLLTQANGYVNPQRDDWKQPRRLGDFVTLTLVKGGVITGKVLDSSGQPLVGATVKTLRVRDDKGQAGTNWGGEALSDDRGVYRIYGLDTGAYVVWVSGGYGLYYNDQVKEAPTYHPSSTRDSAAEVSVQLGAVTAGIDIRHRGERGHAISGTFSGYASAGSWVSVYLMDASTGAFIEQINNHPPTTGKNNFAFYGLADGEYELQARQQAYNRANRDLGAASEKRKVTVKGGDITGIELRMSPLAAIAGRIVLESSEKKDCAVTRRGEIEEVRMNSLREEEETLTPGVYEMSPDEKNEFSLPELLLGTYRLDVQLPSDHWYLKAISITPKNTTGKSPATKTLDVARQGLSLKAGEKKTDVTLTIAEGAAELRGRVEGRNLPARLRVHLVPAEKDAEKNEDVLRYAEVLANADGTFAFTHLAPGNYWLLARAVPDDESDGALKKPVAWQENKRTQLRREAEAANQAITLKDCERVKEFRLKFAAAVK